MNRGADDDSHPRFGKKASRGAVLIRRPVNDMPEAPEIRAERAAGHSLSGAISSPGHGERSNRMQQGRRASADGAKESAMAHPRGK
jgi:hypothetical protein